MSGLLVIAWVIVTVLIFSWVAYVLHKGGESSQVKLVDLRSKGHLDYTE